MHFDLKFNMHFNICENLILLCAFQLSLACWLLMHALVQHTIYSKSFFFLREFGRVRWIHSRISRMTHHTRSALLRRSQTICATNEFAPMIFWLPHLLCHFYFCCASVCSQASSIRAVNQACFTYTPHLRIVPVFVRFDYAVSLSLVADKFIHFEFNQLHSHSHSVLLVPSHCYAIHIVVTFMRYFN